MSENTDLTQQRYEKLRQITELGFDPYPHKFARPRSEHLPLQADLISDVQKLKELVSPFTEPVLPRVELELLSSRLDVPEGRLSMSPERGNTPGCRHRVIARFQLFR